MNIVRVLHDDVRGGARSLERGFDQTEASARLRLTNASPAVETKVVMITISSEKTGAVAISLHQRQSEHGSIKLLTLIK